MSHFHLTLPSNSSARYYPDNTKTHFVTKLLGDYEMQGDWEVGLSEILFSKSWYNINEGEAITLSYGDGRYEIKISEGYYDSAKELVRQVNREIDKFYDFVTLPVSRPPKFTFNRLSNKIKMEVHSHLDVSFTRDLARIIGFEENIKSGVVDEIVTVEGRRASDMHAGLQAIYVYCDLLEYVPVGDIKAPLLRIVDVGDERHCAFLKRVYEKPRYIPLQKKCFDSVEIDLRTDKGTPVPFQRGKVIVTLHFRRAQGNHFS